MENFYSLMGGDENYRSWLTISRPTKDFNGVYTWSPGINFGIDDVFGYITMNYANQGLYVGGGHSNAIDWYGSVSFEGHTHSEYALTNHSHNYLSTNGGNVSGTVSVTRDIGVSAGSYTDCQFVANAPTNSSNGARAGYGFHNFSVNACELFLETDGNLYQMRNSGSKYKMLSTSHFTVSDNTLTIYL